MTTPLRVCAFLCLLLFLSATPGSAQIAVYIEGSIQGPIQGDLLLLGEENNIGATSFSSSNLVPYDPATGRPNGRNQYSPIMLTKNKDSATVPMIQALLTNETLKRVRIRLYSSGQTLLNYYTIELANAFLVSHEQSGLDNSIPSEVWGFTFESITWTDELTGISTTDTWADVVAAVLPPGPSSNLTLLPPLPNPTGAESMIRFDLPLASRATLDIYDVRGRRVTRLFDEFTNHQRTVVRWNGRDNGGDLVANGLYLVRLQWPEGEVTQRVTLMR